MDLYMDNRTSIQDDLFFGSLVNAYVINNPRFLRRDWLANEVTAQLVQPECHFVLLTAQPGFGKSIFMAQLAYDHRDWLRYFIRRDQRTPLGDVDVHSFLLHIGYQLAALHPELFTQEQVRLSVEQRIGDVKAKAKVVDTEVARILRSPFYQRVVEICQYVERNAGRIVGLKLEELIIETRLFAVGDLQYMALLDPARALLESDPAAQVVVLVDALDEIRYHNVEDNILNWLTNCPELPPNVHFVLSTRPLDDALNVFYLKQAIQLRKISPDLQSREVCSDVHRYATGCAMENSIKRSIIDQGLQLETFLQAIVAYAAGNLGYVGYLFKDIQEAIENGHDTRLKLLLKLQIVPSEQERLCAFLLRQIKTEVDRQHMEMTDPETKETYPTPVWHAVYLHILGVLAVSREPLALSQIVKYGHIGVDQGYVKEALNRLSQFLICSENRYRLFHQSLAEFLTSDRTRERPETADLFVDPIAWHRRICSSILAKLGL